MDERVQLVQEVMKNVEILLDRIEGFYLKLKIFIV